MPNFSFETFLNLLKDAAITLLRASAEAATRWPLTGIDAMARKSGSPVRYLGTDLIAISIKG